MANLHDYLRWRGDITLAERPFNDADNLVLATLAYLDFTNIVPAEGSGASVSVASACRALLHKAGNDFAAFVRSVAKVDAQFVHLLADARRFSTARLSDYVDVVDPERSLQFSAITITLNEHEVYVAFRGTDGTIVGWRENFTLSFGISAAQREALAYLERTIGHLEEPDTALRVGGHSKGGNLAEFAAACANEELRARISRVYSNDGPGMAPEAAPVATRKILGDKFRHIVPAYSVIGMLFADPQEQRYVIVSNGQGIEQHDPTTWQLTPQGMEHASGLLAECEVVNKTIASWAEKIPVDERQQVIDDVFDALQTGGATTFAQIAESPEQLQKVASGLTNTDKRTRNAAWLLLESALSTSADVMRGAVRKAMEETGRLLNGPAA